MEELTLEHFYAQSLALEEPWRVAGVVIDGESKEVRIRVECAAGEPWIDPETRESASPATAIIFRVPVFEASSMRNTGAFTPSSNGPRMLNVGRNRQALSRGIDDSCWP
jgi:hypothetical protein